MTDVDALREAYDGLERAAKNLVADWIDPRTNATNLVPEALFDALAQALKELARARLLARHYPRQPEAGEKCPECGSPEVAALSPRTFYACGSSYYDQRPGTFNKGERCKPAGPPKEPAPEPKETRYVCLGCGMVLGSGYEGVVMPDGVRKHPQIDRDMAWCGPVVPESRSQQGDVT